jgi:hypothetical protein
LRKVLRFAKRSQINVQIRELRGKIAKSPSPALYEKLASIYLELSDLSAVQGTCEECIRRFPSYFGAYLVLARARLRNFYRDLMARDGLAAVRLLRHVLSLSPGYRPAEWLLAELLYRVGAVVETRLLVEVLCRVEPPDQHMEKIKAELAARPSVVEDLDVLFHAVETSGKLPHAAFVTEERPSSLAAEGNLRLIREGLARLAQMPGVGKAVYIRGGRAVVKGDIKDGKDPFLRLVRVIARASQRTCRRLDIGSFKRGVVAGGFGRVCICCYGEVVSAVQCLADSNVEHVLSNLQDLVAGSLAVASRWENEP